MATWDEFAAASPELAAGGRRLIYRAEIGDVLLCTVRASEPPRIHPIWVSIVEGRLYAFILASAKRGDLVSDGRYALHTHVDPVSPSEFSVRGHARRIDDPQVRSAVGGAWYFAVDGSYELFEFSIDAAILGDRDSADEWPPRYTAWKLEDRG